MSNYLSDFPILPTTAQTVLLSIWAIKTSSPHFLQPPKKNDFQHPPHLPPLPPLPRHSRHHSNL